MREKSPKFALAKASIFIEPQRHKDTKEKKEEGTVIAN